MQNHPLVGKTFGHYKVLEFLGGGGMGVVYKAEDTRLQRIVALKFLPFELTQNPQAKARFEQEARAASGLDHPNICTIHAIDQTEDGQMFLCMAYYEGETLRKPEPGQKPDIQNCVDIAIQIGQGLERAHENGIVHRDIKPANIIVTKDGFVKILDFGLAKLGGATKITKTGTTMGTPAYMAPEQVKGQEVDHRVDIWSLGVILYEQLTGELPYKGDYEMAILYSILNEEPPPPSQLNPDIPPELERIVRKAMSKDVNQRYSHMREMVGELLQFKAQLMQGQPLAPGLHNQATVTIQTPRPDLPEKDAPTMAMPQGHSDSPRKIRLKVLLPLAFGLLLLVVGVLNLETIQSLLAPKQGYLTINSQPEGAEILIDGRATGSRTPTQANRLQAGTHTIALALDGYHGWSGNISIAAGDTITKTIPLEPIETPQASPLLTDSNPSSKATSGQGSPPRTRPPEKPEPTQGNASAIIPATNPTVGSLTVVSTPPGAAIFIDDQPTGKQTPHTFSDLPAGTHRVRLVQEGFLEEVRDIEISSNRQQQLRVALREPPLGRLRVVAILGDNPFEIAEVYVNGKAVDRNTPVTLPLKPGSYDVTVKKFGYRPNPPILHVAVESVKEIPVRFELVKIDEPGKD